jgi:hypothetical protein
MKKLLIGYECKNEITYLYQKKLLWQLAVVKRFINESIRFLYAEVGKELNNII